MYTATYTRVLACLADAITAYKHRTLPCLQCHSVRLIGLQVLDLWQRRQILAKSVLKPALDLLGKMKGEHEAAAAAAAMAAYKMGQPLVPRRPLRLLMPYALLDSDTGLPTHTICYPLDQWGSLAGFRYCCLCCLLSMLHVCLSHGNAMTGNAFAAMRSSSGKQRCIAASHPKVASGYRGHSI